MNLPPPPSGQSLKRVSLYLLDGEVFSHGALYVAFSRATTKDGIRVLPLPSDPESETRRPRNWIRNEVWPEVLDEEDRPALRRPPPTTHQVSDADGRPYSMMHDEDIGGEQMDDQAGQDDQQVEGPATGVSPSQGSSDLIVVALRFSQLIFAPAFLQLDVRPPNQLEAECPSAVRLLDEARLLSEARSDEADGEEDESFGPLG